MNVTAMLFTRLRETQERTERLVQNCENYRPSEGGRFSVSIHVGVCMCLSGEEVVDVDMIVCVSGLEKLASSL